MSIEERLFVPKSLVVRRTKSSTKNCWNCKYFYYASEGRSSCSKLLTTVSDFEHTVCLGFKKEETSK